MAVLARNQRIDSKRLQTKQSVQRTVYRVQRAAYGMQNEENVLLMFSYEKEYQYSVNIKFLFLNARAGDLCVPSNWQEREVQFSERCVLYTVQCITLLVVTLACKVQYEEAHNAFVLLHRIEYVCHV